jgi:glycerol-3-phosphate dehydrogenase (NAD(P)+)
MGRITVLGAGSWGTTLAVVYARHGHDVMLWDHDAMRAQAMQQDHENARYLPDIRFPERVAVTADLAAAIDGSSLLILAVPAQAIRALAVRISPVMPPEAIVVVAAKGLEIGTCRRMTEVVADNLRPRQRRGIAVLSGPNLAGEIVRELPAASVVAARHRPVAVEAQSVLSTPRLRLYVSTDVVGVEIGGALKNVMALVAGLAEGLGYGDNSKASIITRGLAEITRLGTAAGARQATFAGLSGLGDLIATCASPLSRNHHVGYELGRGRTLAEIQAQMTSVAEGITTTRAAYDLARRYGVEMPIVEQVYAVLFEGKSPHAAVDDLLARTARDELTRAPL